MKGEFVPEMEEKPLLPAGLLESAQEMQMYMVRRREMAKRMEKRKLWLENERSMKRKKVGVGVWVWVGGWVNDCTTGRWGLG